MFRNFKKKECESGNKKYNETDDFDIITRDISIYFYFSYIRIDQFSFNFRNIYFTTAYQKINDKLKIFFLIYIMARRRTRRRNRRSRRNRNRNRNRSRRRRGAGALGVLKQALVPYFLYVAQKRMQRKVKKSRRRRR